jgi:hypothetical protein
LKNCTSSCDEFEALNWSVNWKFDIKKREQICSLFLNTYFQFEGESEIKKLHIQQHQQSINHFIKSYLMPQVPQTNNHYQQKCNGIRNK